MRKLGLLLAAVCIFGCGGTTVAPPDGTGATGGTAGSGASAGSGGSGAGAGSSTGGSAGTPDGGSPGGHVECQTIDDCTIFTDCCSCAAVPKTEVVPSCLMECLVTECGARGIGPSDATCIAGRCVIARSCNETAALCRVAPPACSQGQAPVVVNACYEGSCLPVGECSDVASCSVCEQANMACVTLVAEPTSFHCVTIPDACAQGPTCACMGVCVGPFECTAPESASLRCDCATC